MAVVRSAALSLAADAAMVAACSGTPVTVALCVAATAVAIAAAADASDAIINYASCLNR